MKKQLIGIISSLVLQYLLGMATNHYVPFAESGTAEDQFTIARTHLLSAAHIIVAFGLLAGSITFLVRAMRSRQQTLKTAAWVGFLSILLAWYGGVSFVATQNDTYSFLMAAAFIIALISYGWSLFLMRDERAQSTSR